MSQSQQDTATGSGSGSGEYETTEYETATKDDDNDSTIASVASSQTTAASVQSFFDDNKAPESEYEAKIRQAKELEEQKKKREAKRALAGNNNQPLFSGKDNTDPMAAEHYTVEVKRRQWDDDLKAFREKQRKLLKNIRVNSKRKVAALHERIFFTIRWANPVLPSIFKKIILEYCVHLMGPYPERNYSKIKVMHAWYSKFAHTAEAKVVHEVKDLCERLRVLVLKRDDKTVKTIVKLEEKTELLTIKKEGDVRWQMETMHCARDDYWTIWYLSRRNLKLELLRMLETCKDVDVRDPDFGYTSLHYACKEGHWDIFSILLKHGASVKAVIEEDGRQPLHLAAQYGTKEMCLELLAVGADFYAKDKYGSYPLDLAIQSKNYPVIQVLQNWTQLLPPEAEEVVVVEDLSDVPEEFMSTPYEVLLTMSPALRVLTTRLEGIDVNATHSMDSGMDLGVEIRLCERRCNMCLDEGFGFEALKSKKRRWTVAKNGYVKQLQAEAGTGTGSGGGGGGGGQKGVTDSEGEARGEGGESPVHLKGTSCIAESASGNNELKDESMKKSSILTKAAVVRPPLKLTASLMFSICSDLFESLIREKAYEDAERIMTEGLTVIVLDDATRITFLKRHCQLLLFLSDRMSQVDKFQSSMVGPHVAGSHSRANKKNSKSNIPTIEQSFAAEDFNHTTSYASLNVSVDDSKHYNDTDPLSFTAPPSLLEPSMQHGSVLMDHFASAPLRLEHSHTTADEHKDEHESNEAMTAEHLRQSSQILVDSSAENCDNTSQSFMIPQNVSPYDLILMRAEGDINEGLELLKSNYDFNFIEPLSLSPLLELAAEIADRQGRYSDALHFMEHSGTVKERTLGQAHSDTVRVFIESLRLLLRKQLVLASVRKEKRDVITQAEEEILNESISSKLMNEKKITKIREARKKEAMAEDKKCFSEVGQQATDVSRRLDRLSLENEDEALKLSTKCYNLVSLTELIVQGEVEPNQVLPNSGESISLQSLNSKMFPTRMIHALERSAFGESALNKV
jgi:hypothetical protein